MGELLRDYERDPRLRRALLADERERYVEAHAQPGALTAMLHYYRALGRSGVGVARRSIEAPVLVIWSDHDRYLVPEVAACDPVLVPRARIERLDASHWVQNELPERVNALLIDFLRGTTSGR
jgi:pimeloyl-ACP methyl ester carboxylesterase